MIPATTADNSRNGSPKGSYVFGIERGQSGAVSMGTRDSDADNPAYVWSVAVERIVDELTGCPDGHDGPGHGIAS